VTYRSVTHVALHVESLADSEAYYGELFGMEVVLREEISMLARDALIIRDRFGMQWEITTIWPPA